MQAYKIEKKLSQDGILTLKGLPFHSDENIEIIILKSNIEKTYPSLKGKVLEYKNPYEPVAQDDWEILK